jgi:hypothetical protein
MLPLMWAAWKPPTTPKEPPQTMDDAIPVLKDLEDMVAPGDPQRLTSREVNVKQ